MDFSAIGALGGAITSAIDIGKAALGARDANLIQEAVVRLNQEVLNAQEALLRHQAVLLQLQNEHFECTQELRRLQEALNERARYSLFEIARGNFAYRLNVAPQGSASGNPTSAEPMHYLCQPCFDKGSKAVLGWVNSSIGASYVCPLCKREIFEM